MAIQSMGNQFNLAQALMPQGIGQQQLGQMMMQMQPGGAQAQGMPMLSRAIMNGIGSMQPTGQDYFGQGRF